MKCKVIAITGKIGSGKSTVGRYLVQLGYNVIDCDQLSREIQCLPEVQSKVKTLLGENSVVDGKLNRPFIRQTVFFDDELYSRYNQIFFDQIKQEVTTAVSKLSLQQNCNVVFVEIPLIDAFYYPWDAVWMVASPLDIRVSRVKQRDGVNDSDVIAVSGKQVYSTKPTHVITNDGSVSDLYKTVDKLISQIA